ncbi:MAG: replication associated protein [Microviridae sp. ctKAt32]|nr:MAG: replication associated protein [Microviridae sp. ctKAt32]
MPCYSPLQAWKGDVLASGKREIVFKKPNNAYGALPVSLPCGQCIGCRLERSRQWAMRCMDEASLYKENCFITLTYDDKNLPVGGSLEKRDFQLFMKRLRKEVNYASIKGFVGPRMDYRKLRFFHCGEYGETNGRPHYHACLFNYSFPDCVFYRVNRNGDKLYTSAMLSSIWKKGISIVGAVTFESAAYVARYVVKKFMGSEEDKDRHYLNEETGEILPSEYVTMSRRPGIGKGYYDKWKSDMFPSDQKVVRGKVMVPPRYYFNEFEVDNPEGSAIVRAKRLKNRVKMVDGIDDNCLSRLVVREGVLKRKISNFTREV